MTVRHVARDENPTLFDFLDGMDWTSSPASVVDGETTGNAKRGHLAFTYTSPMYEGPDYINLWAIVDLGNVLHFTGSGLHVGPENARIIAQHLLAFAERQEAAQHPKETP